MKSPPPRGSKHWHSAILSSSISITTREDLPKTRGDRSKRKRIFTLTSYKSCISWNPPIIHVLINLEMAIFVHGFIAACGRGHTQIEYSMFHLLFKEEFWFRFVTKENHMKLFSKNPAKQPKNSVLILDPPDTASRAIITNDWNGKCSKDSTAKRLMSWLKFFRICQKNCEKLDRVLYPGLLKLIGKLGRWSWVSSCRLILMIKVVHKTSKLNGTCSLRKKEYKFFLCLSSKSCVHLWAEIKLSLQCTRTGIESSSGLKTHATL